MEAQRNALRNGSRDSMASMSTSFENSGLFGMRLERHRHGAVLHHFRHIDVSDLVFGTASNARLQRFYCTSIDFPRLWQRKTLDYIVLALGDACLTKFRDWKHVGLGLVTTKQRKKARHYPHL